MQRPDTTEYDGFYDTYVSKVPEGDVMELLETSLRRTQELLAGLPAEWESFAYEDGKWTIREVLGHMADTERVFSYRALSFARRDPAPLPGMDQNQWLADSNAGSRSLPSLLADFASVRRASLALFDGFGEEVWDLRGTASGCDFSVRSFPYIIAGHEIHHQGVLEERYLARLRER